jgi:hypothetical protein
MSKKFTLVILCLAVFTAFSQNQRSYLKYIFPSDSLEGFDIPAAEQKALSDGYFGSEYIVYMYAAKRNYINQKYYPAPTSVNVKKGNPVVMGAPCTNEDFEASPTGTFTSVSGWTFTQGQNLYVSPGGSCSMNGCCPNTLTTSVFIRSTPYVAPAPLGTIPNSPLGGSKVIQLNDNIPSGGEVIRMRQTFPVSASNTMFQYAFISQIDGSGHACCSQPYLNVSFFNCSSSTICSYSYIPTGGTASCVASPAAWSTTSVGVAYNPGWQTSAVDLSAYVGSCVTVEVTIGDCDGWGHAGYCFFDALCSPMQMLANGIGTSPSGVIDLCGSSIAQLVAPGPGFLSYNWMGPAGSGITNNPNQLINTTTPGVYSLTMTTGPCVYIKTFTLAIGNTPSVTAMASASTACTNGSPIALTGNPPGGTFSGTGVSGTLFNPPGSAGNYTVTYSYTDPATFCSNTYPLSISVAVCSGIESYSPMNGSVKIYPNPSNGEFRIQTLSEEIISITNELGQTVKVIKLDAGNNFSSTVSNLTAGIYFASGKDFKEKIVVTK